MSSFSSRVGTFIAVLYVCVPALLVCQSKVTLRPEFDQRLSSRVRLYPHEVLKRPKVALVLSGGGARSAAQIGVLRALERHGVPVDFISGTSLGAVVGGLYASGYTVAELESIAVHTNWDEVLSLTDETNRRERSVEQKLADDRSFLVLRFEGLQPVIPLAVSSGQRLTDFLSSLTLQALYHPRTGFDDLKIPFRCVSTDLISGQRVVLKDGSLSEALRATASVPLLFNPIEKDSMRLVDGGLLSNIPVDVAREHGSDLVIAVNSTSGLRNASELKVPWQTADQIMGIMMQLSNEQQLKGADIVITPHIGKHSSSDFKGLDTLIAEGERAAEVEIDNILSLYRRKAEILAMNDWRTISHPSVEFLGHGVSDSLRKVLALQTGRDTVRLRDIRGQLAEIYQRGDVRDISADVFEDSPGTRIVYTVVYNPVVREVRYEGCNVVAADILVKMSSPLIGRPLNDRSLEDFLENVLRLYRSRGYSLARIVSTSFDDSSGVFRVVVNEGVLSAIDVQGGVRTRDEFLLSDFPLAAGEVFEIDKARRGITNLNGTKLFEFVYLEVSDKENALILTVRLRERPSQLVRFGFHADNERAAEGSVDIRDENFRGSGMELGLTLMGGGRNQDALLEFKKRQLFGTALSLNAAAFYGAVNTYLYADAPPPGPNEWDRLRVGEYREERYGGKLILGTQLERLGMTTMEFSLQDVRTRDLQNAENLEDRYRLAVLRFGTLVDTKDSYPFPTSGIGLKMNYEFAFKTLGSEVSYNALKLSYESFSTWGSRHTFHPKVTFGFADRTMPLAQQFRLGGLDSFFGLHEDDRRGRQMFLMNIEYRYHFSFRIVFDAYLRTRFDIATISSEPEDIKFATLRYGAGGEIALDSPIGPAIFGIGKSFYFSKDLPENPIQQGPFLLYFTIGYQL